jgi:hypothetical protein
MAIFAEAKVSVDGTFGPQFPATQIPPHPTPNISTTHTGPRKVVASVAAGFSRAICRCLCSSFSHFRSRCHPAGGAAHFRVDKESRPASPPLTVSRVAIVHTTPLERIAPCTHAT